MRKTLATFALLITLLLPGATLAQSTAEDALPEPELTAEVPFDPSAFPQDEFMHGRVDAVLERGERDFGGYASPFQRTRIEILSGPEKGKMIEVEHAGIYNQVDEGARVIVTKVTVEGESNYYLSDEYRLPALGIIFAVFFGLAVLFAGRRGVSAVFGLGFSILVLALYIVPGIAEGGDPLRITLVGSVVIMLVSLFLAHGFSKRTGVALAATGVTLVIACVFAAVFVSFAKLLGIGTDAASTLQLGPLGVEKMRGLLLGGIIIGTLGVLDDVTTAQTAVVEEIVRADGTLGVHELYKRGLSVGREHIASLVNTIALAYAGTSLPLFLLFTLERQAPYWVLLNSETVAEELVRTMVGSATLVCAVPIATLFAAYMYGNRYLVPAPHDASRHHHHPH